ncbi:uncharacterized protein Dmul_33960 [Desulfococcus multivorans]|nr:uncharacterized protein Dmul_33960 [Desulfococcus multivorans]
MTRPLKIKAERRSAPRSSQAHPFSLQSAVFSLYKEVQP